MRQCLEAGRDSWRVRRYSSQGIGYISLIRMNRPRLKEKGDMVSQQLDHEKLDVTQ